MLLGSEVDDAGYCDDGNLVSGDGCSSGCREECGYTCSLAAGCVTECGDGLRVGYEGCDDGNQVDGDGCSSTCSVEDGWTCTTAACRTSYCSTTCGDGIRVGAEECDDGNRAWYDGCSYYCTVECGFSCEGGGRGELGGRVRGVVRGRGEVLLCGGL